jgi:hypothetical protein
MTNGMFDQVSSMLLRPFLRTVFRVRQQRSCVLFQASIIFVVTYTAITFIKYFVEVFGWRYFLIE